MPQTESWQYEGTINARAPHLGCRAGKIRCTVGKLPPNILEMKEATHPRQSDLRKKHHLDLRSTSQVDSSHVNQRPGKHLRTLRRLSTILHIPSNASEKATIKLTNCLAQE